MDSTILESIFYPAKSDMRNRQTYFNTLKVSSTNKVVTKEILNKINDQNQHTVYSGKEAPSPFFEFLCSKVWGGGLYNEHKTKTVFSELKIWHDFKGRFS